MLPLQSDRLQLRPLSPDQLLLLARDRAFLETALGLCASGLALNAGDGFLEEFAQALTQFVIPGVEAHPEAPEWYTHWLIIDPARNLTVGGIGAAGPPDAEGRAMIGYFIDKKSEGRGYATEAVRCLTGWMAGHPQLKAIIADTPADHSASQQVLRKAGFAPAGAVEEGLRWQWSRP